jgi:glycerophosphoryl diester phosphodiesterase
MLAVAHRGYSSAYPENSALAFEKAIAAGAAYLETDLRLARDGEVVCWHDPDLQRIAGHGTAIADLAFPELAAIRLSQDQHILRLEDVLAIARGRAGVLLDVKVTSGQMIEAVLPRLAAVNMIEHTMYGARSLDHLAAVRRRNDRLAILGMPAQPALAAEFLTQHVPAVRYWEEDVTPERVIEATRAGAAVWVTAGLRKHGEAPGYITVERAATLERMGVAAVLVNNPERVSRSTLR